MRVNQNISYYIPLIYNLSFIIVETLYEFCSLEKGVYQDMFSAILTIILTISTSIIQRNYSPSLSTFSTLSYVRYLKLNVSKHT